MSRNEEILQAIIDGQDLSIIPQSRNEALMIGVGERVNQLNSDLPKYKKTGYLPSYANQNPIDLSASWDGFNQPIHPKVLYIPEGFCGYEYWLVMSPLPVGASPYPDRWENPVVFKSHNGITDWIVVDSANPLDDITTEQIARGDYLSDPHLVYRRDLKRLEVWYRDTQNTIVGENRLPTAILRKYTTDGTTWSDRETLINYKSQNDAAIFISHSVWWDEEQQLYVAYHVTNTHTKISTSPDATTWTLVRKCYTDKDMYIWHMDIDKINGQYIYAAANNVNGAIEIYTSDNGYLFKFQRILLSEKFVQGVYRPCVCKDDNGMLRVYVSVKSNNAWKIVLFIGDSIETLQWASGTDIVETNNSGSLVGETKEQAEFRGSQVTVGGQALPNLLDEMWKKVRTLEAERDNVGRPTYSNTELKDSAYSIANRYINLDVEPNIPNMKWAYSDIRKMVFNAPIKQRTWYKVTLSGTHSQPLIMCVSKKAIPDIIAENKNGRIDALLYKAVSTVSSYLWYNDDYNFLHLDCDTQNRTSIVITEVNMDVV